MIIYTKYCKSKAAFYISRDNSLSFTIGKLTLIFCHFFLINVPKYKYKNDKNWNRHWYRHTPRNIPKVQYAFKISMTHCLAIRITYRSSQRSSSMCKPRHPLLKVINILFYILTAKSYRYIDICIWNGTFKSDIINFNILIKIYVSVVGDRYTVANTTFTHTRLIRFHMGKQSYQW